MGRNRNQRRSMRMDDTDDDTMSTGSTATSSDVTSTQEVEERDENTVLEGFIDALYEKRAKTREEGLKGLINALKSNVLTGFVDAKHETLVHLCIGSIKKGSGSEIVLASQIIGLVAVSSGAGDIAQQTLSEASSHLIKAAKLGSDSKARIAALEALAMICFVGSSNYEATEEVMVVLWQISKHKGNYHSEQTLGMNKPSSEVRAAALSAWTFLLTIIPTTRIISHHMSQCLSTLSSLLENEDQAVRISAGEAIAILFETNTFGSQYNATFEDLSSESVSTPGKKNFDGKEADVVEQIRGLALEAGGKGQANKKAQRSSFKDILSIVEGRTICDFSLKLQQGDLLILDSWSQMIQLKFLTGVLVEGLQRHLQENILLHEVFGFVPRQEKRKTLTSKEKRMYMSPNSVLSKARTRTMNRRRCQAHAGQVGHYGISAIEYSHAHPEARI